MASRRSGADDRPAKDRQSITADGKLLRPLIEGVVVRPATTIEDARGEVVEVYRPSWNVHPEPLVFVYQVLIRPGKIKGWTLHHQQEDRVFNSFGVLRWALYDVRPESPTKGLVNEFVFSHRNRTLLIIPRGVYHAVQNIGETEAMFVNMPTRPYDYADPDKYRLPIKNDVIPFSFDDGPGW